MATTLGGSKVAAVMKKGDRLTLGAPHPQGGGKVFWATVLDASEEKYNGREGMVRTDWIVEDPMFVLPTAQAGRWRADRTPPAGVGHATTRRGIGLSSVPSRIQHQRVPAAKRTGRRTTTK